ncbi:MAG: VirB3 family type IV secretion system protein [Spirochaetaceae bacterium]|jgi:type IV secretory pathway VirB3-like protein|nr:VirB3 family type IV secretion system protein [Spirochaetaceae bacterium]
MVDTRQYSRKVRRSLLPRDMFAGVPQMGLLLLFILGIVFVYALRMYFMIIIIVLLYFVMRHLTSRDPWMIDIVLENIQQKDIFIP